MQVNSVQSTPSFGMALRIKCPKEDLAKLSKSTLQKLEKFGKEFKDFKYADMDIIEGGTPVLNLRDCANAYSNPSVLRVDGECMDLSGEWRGSTSLFHKIGEQVVSRFEMADPVSVKELSTLHAIDDYERVAKFVREFERRGATLAQRAEIAKADSEARELMASDLLTNYGVNS